MVPPAGLEPAHTAPENVRDAVTARTWTCRKHVRESAESVSSIAILSRAECSAVFLLWMICSFGDCFEFGRPVLGIGTNR